MGVDCIVKTNVGITQLDRWYVFCPPFVSGQKYTKSDALKMISQLCKDLLWKKNKQTQGDNSDRTDYFLHWYKIASQAIKEAPNDTEIIFFEENDINYPND